VSDGAKGGFSTGIPILQNSHIPIPVLPPGVQIALVNIFDRLLGANYGDQRKSQQTERVTHNNSRSRINTRTYIEEAGLYWTSSTNARGLSGCQHRIHVGREPLSDKMYLDLELGFGFRIEITEIIMFMPLNC